MRVIVATILMLISTAALAESKGEPTGAHDRSPDAAEVIGGLYRFDRFQQSLLESADLNGNQEVRNLAALRAEDAAKRDRALKQIERQIGAEPKIEKATIDGGLLAESDDSEGPSYVRKFYAAEIAEQKSVVALIERYLEAPDHAALRSFAREQLSILRLQLKDAERTMADK